MEEDKWDRNDPYRPRLKVFLSCDIVGSTAYKQPFAFMDNPESAIQTIEFRSKWQEIVRRFYSDLPAAFQKNWESGFALLGCNREEVILPEGKTVKRYPSEHGEYYANKLRGRSPFLWKTIGDEIIFWKELSHEHQLWLLISAWMQSLADIRKPLLAQGLDVKSTIWLAEFPVRNATLAFENEPKKSAKEEFLAGENDRLVDDVDKSFRGLSNHIRRRYYAEPRKAGNTTDFIGPGIDLGFRLSSLASSKRMMISVDVAYLLALSELSIKKGTVKSKVKMTSLRPKEAVFSQNDSGDIQDTIEKRLLKLKRSSDFFADGALFAEKEADGMRLNFSGSEKLKGVLGGAKYPIFWINTVPSGSIQAFKDKMYIKNGARKPKRSGVSWQQVLDYCLAFYEDRQAFLVPPVIIPNEKIQSLRTPDGEAINTSNWSASYHEKWVADYEKHVGIVKEEWSRQKAKQSGPLAG